MVTGEHLAALKPRDYTPLQACLDAFLLSKAAPCCAAKTLVHYRCTVGSFVASLHSQEVTDLQQISPNRIRRSLVERHRQGHADVASLAGSCELEGILMKCIEMPKLEQRMPPPFSAVDIRKLLQACGRKTGRGPRNYAIMPCLSDSGLRLAEFASLQLSDVHIRTRSVRVRRGKGGKQPHGYEPHSHQSAYDDKELPTIYGIPQSQGYCLMLGVQVPLCA